MDNNADISKVRHGDSSSHGLRILRPIILEQYPPQRAQWLWERLQECEHVFDDTTVGRGEVFLATMLLPDSAHFELDDSALFSAKEIIPKVNANIHFAVWDKDLSSHKLLSAWKEFIPYLFMKYKLHRLTAIIPAPHTAAIRYANLLGFRYEGQMRQIYLKDGKFYDLLFYGLLESESRRKELIT